jgi:hypothetical protein
MTRARGGKIPEVRMAAAVEATAADAAAWGEDILAGVMEAMEDVAGKVMKNGGK